MVAGFGGAHERMHSIAFRVSLPRSLALSLSLSLSLALSTVRRPEAVVVRHSITRIVPLREARMGYPIGFS